MFVLVIVTAVVVVVVVLVVAALKVVVGSMAASLGKGVKMTSGEIGTPGVTERRGVGVRVRAGR